MSKRSNWKFNYVHEDLFQVFFIKDQANVLKIKNRGSTILPLFLGNDVGVYDGYTFFKISLQTPMVGHKLGEFVKTRQAFRYGKK